MMHNKLLHNLTQIIWHGRTFETRMVSYQCKVYIIPSDVPIAFATGRNPSHAAVAVTEGIQRLLTDDELEVF